MNYTPNPNYRDPVPLKRLPADATLVRFDDWLEAPSVDDGVLLAHGRITMLRGKTVSPPLPCVIMVCEPTPPEGEDAPIAAGVGGLKLLDQILVDPITVHIREVGEGRSVVLLTSPEQVLGWGSANYDLHPDAKYLGSRNGGIPPVAPPTPTRYLS